MSKIPMGAYAQTAGTHIPGSRAGSSPTPMQGKFTRGGGKIGTGSKLKRMMLHYHDTGKR